MKPKKSAGFDPWAELEKLHTLQVILSELPEGAITAEAYAERYNVSPKYAADALFRIHRKGGLERHRYRTEDGVVKFCYTVVPK